MNLCLAHHWLEDAEDPETHFISCGREGWCMTFGELGRLLRLALCSDSANQHRPEWHWEALADLSIFAYRDLRWRQPSLSRRSARRCLILLRFPLFNQCSFFFPRIREAALLIKLCNAASLTAASSLWRRLQTAHLSTSVCHRCGCRHITSL